MKFFHMLMGFLFCFVDTDRFLPEFNVFTGDRIIGAALVYKYYTYLYTAYFLTFCFPGLIRGLGKGFKLTLLALGLLLAFNGARLLLDGLLFSLTTYVDLRNVAMMLIIAAALANPNESDIWLRRFLRGALAAMLFRLVYHFISDVKDTAAFLGVDALSFYGTFSVHCAIVVVFGTVMSILAYQQGRSKKAFVLAVGAVVFTLVIASGFRRLAILRVLAAPALGIGLAYWLQGRVRSALLLLPAIALGGGCVVVVGLVGFYGWDNTVDRFQSMANPFARTASLESNLSYLDDWASFVEVLNGNPFGVGYGNPYGVVRYSDSFDDMVLADYETPLHVGSYELIARSGVFGAILLGTLLWTVCKILLDGRRIRLSRADSFVIAGSCSFLLIALFFPFSAPQMSQVKLMATYGLLLGIAARIVARPHSEVQVAMPRSPREPSAGR